MPEIVEVDRLRRQLAPAWEGRTVRTFLDPSGSKVGRRHVEGEWDYFSHSVKAQPIAALRRVGKNLFVFFEGDDLLAWHIHLSSTGWFMPANAEAREATKPDLIHQHFIHNINSDNVRIRVLLSDGQLWNYHDPRTWGRWQVVLGLQPDMGSIRSLLGVGPDWLLETGKAADALVSHKSRRTTKDVLTDQSVTAGIGNYLACEILFRSQVHPHRRWNELQDKDKFEIARQADRFIEICETVSDHSHWKVFGKFEVPCPRCGIPIGYAKDGSGARGSYYCPACQPLNGPTIH